MWLISGKKATAINIYFFFLYLPSSYDDDDAGTNLRHASLSFASFTACCMLSSCSATSLMHVMCVFGCRPWLLLPSIWQCNTLNDNHSHSILVTCTNHVSRRFLIFWTSDCSCCKIIHIVSFLILSLLDTHDSLLNSFAADFLAPSAGFLGVKIWK